MNKKESLRSQLDELNKEAEFNKALKTVFSTNDGLRVFEYILNLGNFGGVIKGDYSCGAHAVSSQVWADVAKAAPEVVKAFIDLRSKDVFTDRQNRFKQLETQLKEVDDE